MSVIGSETKAEGVLNAQEPLEVRGEFQGEIRSRSRLTVESGGSVRGNVEAPQVVVRGSLVGDVRSTRQLELLAGGYFRGRIWIQPDVLILSPQADFSGSTGVE